MRQKARIAMARWRMHLRGLCSICCNTCIYSGYGREYDYFHEEMGVSIFDELEWIIKQQEDPQAFVSDYCNSLLYEGIL